MKLSTRLSTLLLGVLATVLGGFSLTLYSLAHWHLYRELDDRLESALTMLEAAVDVEPEGLEWEPLDRRLTLGIDDGWDQVRWSVRDPDGKEIDRSANSDGSDFPVSWAPQSWPSKPPDRTMFGDASGWRVGARKLRLTDLLKTGRVHPEDDGVDDDIEYPELVVVAGVSPAMAEASLRQLGAALAVVSAILLAGIALLARMLCARALRPLRRMAQAAQAISARDPAARLPDPQTRDELAELASAFNDLLGRLREVMEKQRRFAGEASHQMRTPLAGILGQIDVTRRRARSAEDYEITLDQVRRDAMRLSQVVESLLFLAREDASALLSEFESVDLCSWVPLHLQSATPHERDGDVTFLADGGEAWIRTHPPLLGQLVENLIDNARKYSSKGQPITVRVMTRAGRAMLQVQDAGIGMSADEVARVFEPFFRSSHRVPGVGLGLTVVQRIAAVLGAAIYLESIPGEGTAFQVEFPEAPAPSTDQRTLQTPAAAM